MLISIYKSKKLLRVLCRYAYCERIQHPQRIRDCFTSCVEILIAQESSTRKEYEIASPPPSVRKDRAHLCVGDKKVGGKAANFFIPPRCQSPVFAKKSEVRGRLKQSRSHPQQGVIILIFECLFRKIVGLAI